MSRNADDANLIATLEETIRHLSTGEGNRDEVILKLAVTRELYAHKLRAIPVVVGQHVQFHDRGLLPK